jgi:SAM-dependent methyltransferase
MTTQRGSGSEPKSAGGTPRLYTDLAWIWPILSPPEDYADEAATLVEVCRQSGVAAVRPRLLDLGAGGGHMLLHLRRDFECTAVDLSESMLENCARLVPDSRRILGDMRELRLKERFDVVLIHDAVDYMRSPADVSATLATAAAHLNPGGLLLVAPTYTRDNFIDAEVADDSSPEHGLTFFSYVHDPDPTDDEYELILIYLLRDSADRSVTVVEDRHRCGLFAEDEWLGFFAAAGFHGRLVEDDKAWTLFAARLD